MADEPTTNSGGNIFAKRYGPLPLWGWMAIALVLAAFYYLYKKNQNPANYSSSPSSVNTPGGVDASLVPQFVNQTYVENAPPAAPATTPSPSRRPPTTIPNLPLNEILQQGHVISPNPKKAVIGWTIKQQSPNATQLQVVLNGPGHKNQTRYIPASATTATFDGLSPGHTYVADITPVDSAGQAVGGPNHVTFVTSK